MKKEKKKNSFKIIIYFFLIIFFILSTIIGFSIGAYFYHIKGLPSLEPLEGYKSSKWSLPSQVYSSDGVLISQFYAQKREIVSLDKIPDYLKKAVIAMEDARFYSHFGIDIFGIMRAAIINLKAGRVVQGGSTITQQLAKVLFLTRDRTFSRKIKEALLSLKIEQTYTKDEILERYFNKIYFGEGAYGVQAAAQIYFGKNVWDLNIGESTLLVILPKAPSYYSPLKNKEKAKKRHKIALLKLAETGYITKKQALKIYDEFWQYYIPELHKIKKEEQHFPDVGAWYAEYVRQKLLDKYGEELVYKGGLKIITAMNYQWQKIAEAVVEEKLFDYNLNKKIPEEEIEKHPEIDFDKVKIEGALVAIEPKTGYVRVIVGGSRFSEFNQLNRATQTKRQPGSAFKVFLYSAALDNGFTPASILLDQPRAFETPEGVWIPKNYTNKFYGKITLRRALEKSLNVATVYLLEKVKPAKVVEYAKRCGIKSFLQPFWSIALGGFDVTLLEMVNAYSTFADNGIKTKPVFILKVIDRQGRILENNLPYQERVLDEKIAYLINSILMGVNKRGTGIRVSYSKIRRQTAGKTGTTDNYRDAWYIGYIPQLCAGVWVGYDKFQISLGKSMSGGHVALPVWISFMEKILKDIPKKNFVQPEGIIFENICEESGLLATDRCSKVLREAFIKGTEPNKYCDIH